MKSVRPPMQQRQPSQMCITHQKSHMT
jgi:hypothetical protein